MSEKPPCFVELVQGGLIKNGEYNTNKNDLIRDFYAPILKSSIHYDRTTGSFTAAGIKALAGPLSHLIRNAVTFESQRPVMRIVASHDIPERDYDQIAEGYRRRAQTPDEILVELLKSLKDSTDEELIRAVRNLGTMVQLGLIDIKVAIPTNKLRGMYHRKIGIFTDFCGGRVTFEGSQNVSIGGERSELNLEGLVAFCSKDEVIEGFKSEHYSFFEQLWENRLENVLVRPLDQYPKELLAGFGVPVDQILDELRAEQRIVRIPHECQRLAVNSWIENDHKGILDMCTGSGKTRAALMCLDALKKNPLTIIVCGNLIDLVEQWYTKEISEYFELSKIEVVRMSSAHGNQNELSGLLRDTTLDFQRGLYDQMGKRVFVLATIQTASQQWFVDMINRVDRERLAIVIDEVHHAGSPGPTGNVLKINAKYRIGLSATWRRYDDDENLSLEGYFSGSHGAVAYTYPLSRGIKDDLLSEYVYYLHTVNLDPQDALELRSRLEKYDKALKEIDPSLSIRFGDEVFSKISVSKWEKVRQMRNGLRDALGKALAKTDLALNIIKENYETLRKCVVYCANKEQLDRVAILMSEEGWDLSPYDSNVPKDDRTAIRLRFDRPYRGKPMFIGAIKCLDEGIDLPALDSAILVSSNRTEREWIQRRGRILRLSTEKEYSIIHDLLMLPEASASLTKAERDFVSSELDRLESFGRDARNSQEVLDHISKLRRDYQT